MNRFSERMELMVPGTGFQEYGYLKYYTTMMSLRSVMTHRFSKRLSNRTGFLAERISYDIQALERNPDEHGFPLLQENTGNGLTGTIQAFTQFRWAVNDALAATAGVNSSLFLLNNSITLEPRLGLDYHFLDENS